MCYWQNISFFINVSKTHKNLPLQKHLFPILSRFIWHEYPLCMTFFLEKKATAVSYPLTLFSSYLNETRSLSACLGENPKWFEDFMLMLHWGYSLKNISDSCPLQKKCLPKSSNLKLIGSTEGTCFKSKVNPDLGSRGWVWWTLYAKSLL